LIRNFDAIAPPRAETDEALRPLMVQQLSPRH